jgi:hypothetical protein
LRDAWLAVVQAMKDAWAWFVQKLKSLWNTFKEWIFGAWKSIKDFFIGVWDTVHDYFIEKIAAMKKAVIDLYQKIKEVFDINVPKWLGGGEFNVFGLPDLATATPNGAPTGGASWLPMTTMPINFQNQITVNANTNTPDDIVKAVREENTAWWGRELSKVQNAVKTGAEN